MTELWKPVVDYEGLYEVSNLGRIRSLPRKGTKGGILRPGKVRKGYHQVSLTRGMRGNPQRVHRIVAQAWIPNPDNKPQVNHKNGIKSDNRVENLEWMTNLENMRHAIANGLNPGYPTKAIESRMDGVFQKKNGEVIAMYPCIKYAQYITGICNQNIFKVCQGKRKTAGGYQWEFA